jgi:hypothetical protein
LVRRLQRRSDGRSARRIGQREDLTRAALIKVTDANVSLCTGVDYEIGEGTLMFQAR